MWFDVEAVPLSFTESAPYKFETIVLIDAPPGREVLSSNAEGCGTAAISVPIVRDAAGPRPAAG